MGLLTLKSLRYSRITVPRERNHHDTKPKVHLTAIQYMLHHADGEIDVNVETVAKLFPELSDIPRQSLREGLDEYGDRCLWADVDITSELNSANLLVCTLNSAGSSRKRSVEIEFV